MRAKLSTLIRCTFAVVVLAACGSSGPNDAGPTEDAATVPAPTETAAVVVAYHPVDTAAPPSADCIARTLCLRQYYQNLTWQDGPTRALEVLSAHGRADAQLEDQCHDTTHAIGEVAGRLEPFALAMERGDERCGSGYYHGVIATYLTKLDPAEVVDALVTACGSSGDGFRRWECYHGVGHGFVFNVAGDIFKAIESCGSIEAPSDRGACASGAFMQELVDNGGKADLYADDPYRVCRQVQEQQMLATCFDMHAVIIFAHRVTDAERFAVCGTVPDVNRVDCYEGLGRALFSGMPLQGPRAEEFCAAGGSRASFDGCLAGAISNSAAYYGSGTEALRHCNEFSTDDLERYCIEVLDAGWADVDGAAAFDTQDLNTQRP